MPSKLRVLANSAIKDGRFGAVPVPLSDLDVLGDGRRRQRVGLGGVVDVGLQPVWVSCIFIGLPLVVCFVDNS